MTVVSDTTPLHYLVLIGGVDVLPALFGTVVIPEAVHAELRHPHAPEAVREWLEAPPPWLQVMVVPPTETPLLRGSIRVSVRRSCWPSSMTPPWFCWMSAPPAR